MITEYTGLYVTASGFAISVGTSNTAVLPANAQRRYAVFHNEGSNPMWLTFGVSASISVSGVRLEASGNSGCRYEMSPRLGNLYLGAINGIASSTMTVIGVEGSA